MDIELVELAQLRPHEHTLPERVETMTDKLQRNDFFHKPILIDRRTMTILDGHHRHQASLRLGLLRVPAICLDYLVDERIAVEPWRPEELPSLAKQTVLASAQTGRLMKPKSSKHTVAFGLPALAVPLTELR